MLLSLVRLAASGAILVHEHATDKQHAELRILLGIATFGVLLQTFPNETELTGKVVIGALMRSWTVPLLLLTIALEPRLGPRTFVARRAAVLVILWLPLLLPMADESDGTAGAQAHAAVALANGTLTWDNVLKVPSLPTVDTSVRYTQQRAAIAAVTTIALCNVWLRQR